MKPKIIYGAAINLNGLWGPYRMTYNKSLDIYFDKTGNFSVKRTGKHIPYNGIVTFGSINHKSTVLWTEGVKATMKMLKSWCR